MKNNILHIESRRLAIQSKLDASKSASERNVLGQFATPPHLAREIMAYARTLVGAHTQLKFLEPSLGTGSFFSALINEFGLQRLSEARAFEIDPVFADAARELWKHTSLQVETADFTNVIPDRRYNLVVANPPYTRHHHLSQTTKKRLKNATFAATGLEMGGLSGLYSYFIGLTHAWLSSDAVSAWLIPSEFMDVNYGEILKRYLLENVTLLHIHRYDPAEAQFDDALVTSAIIWFRNAAPPVDHEVLFSFGGTLLKPFQKREVPIRVLNRERKWSRFPKSDIREDIPSVTIGDLFDIRRGLATGNNKFFVVSEDQLKQQNFEPEAFIPILPAPRHLKTDEVHALPDGSPDIGEKRQFLLNTRLSEQELAAQFSGVAQYIRLGEEQGVHEGYLCSKRSPWYALEQRIAAPIVCTYMGRFNSKNRRPFRFILNHSQATITNVYLAMYPKPSFARAIRRNPELLRDIWGLLNLIDAETLLGEGRVYGGGLYKLEPRELARVPLDLPRQYNGVVEQQGALAFE